MADPRCEWPMRRNVRGKVVEAPPCCFRGRCRLGPLLICNVHRRMLKRWFTGRVS